MASPVYRGDAPATAQVWTLTPGGTIEVGDLFRIAVRGRPDKYVEFAATATTAADVAAGLVAAWNLSTIPEMTEITASGTVTVILTADNAGRPFEMTLTTTESDGTAADAQTFTGAETTRSRGPNHYDDPGNWSTDRVPDTDDDISFDVGKSDVLYGLRQHDTFTADAATDVITVTGPCHFVTDQIVRVTNSGGGLPAGLLVATNYYIISLNRYAGTFKVSLTSGGAAVDITTAGTGTHTIAVEAETIEVTQRFEGTVGLHIVNSLNSTDYREYREHYLTIGIDPAGTKSVQIGTKEGNGSSRIKIDTGAYQTELSVVQTGGGLESLPAVHFLNSNSASNLKIKSGQFGLAVLSGETSSVNNITGESESVLTIGEVTIGGTLDAYSPLFCHNITMNSSALIVH